MVIVGVVVLAAVLLCLPILTGLGERRRGARAALAVLAGVFFPITWVVWYSRDELPGHRLSRRGA